MDETEFELMELEDQVAEVGKLTPREYAKLRGIAPQRVYYFVRTGAIKLEVCICGRRVVDVHLADETFQTKARQRGGVLDTRPDEARRGDEG